jgi:amino acid adenylation domain-containing protein
MSDFRPLPPEQEAIRAKCFHPTESFVEFTKEDVEQSIPERFEKIVRKYPDRLAIKGSDQSLTYDELNQAANRIGHAIFEKRGGSNQPVAILMEHGASVLVSVLGVLKSGGIYVPLDPSYPLERLRFMMSDAQAEILVTNNLNLSRSREIAGPHHEIINADETKRAPSTGNIGLKIAPEALAYILYTSGSTGRPKGVVDTNRNVLHGTLRFTNGLHIVAEDRLSFTHSCSSSASVRRIFPALLNGATLFPLNVRQEGMEGVFNLIVREEITYVSLGRIRDFLRTASGEQRLNSLRLVSFGGEIVQKTDVERCRKLFPPHCLIGVWFSSTETGNVTQFMIDGDTRISGDIVPIGYPAEDMQVLLLDDAGNPVTDDQFGQIAVRSRYLSPGYWRRPDLTNQRFLPDPDGGEKRIYLTGDLGRMEPDGCFFHLGRIDDQVKIRGYRVELAEIEGALLRLKGIRKAFVKVTQRSSTDKTLIAYLVPEQLPAPTATALRGSLARTLPDYMIPSVFVMLEELPLTPTGKVDRNALPNPGTSRPELDIEYVAPKTPVEQELARLWSQVLSLDRVGIHDNFFDLGGHSLMATRIVSRVIKTFQVEVRLQALFAAPTVAEMAAVITEHQAKKLGEQDLDRILAELESLSEDEATKLLAVKVI